MITKHKNTFVNNFNLATFSERVMSPKKATNNSHSTVGGDTGRSGLDVLVCPAAVFF